MQKEVSLVTRQDIINLLKTNQNKTREERRTIIDNYLTQSVLTAEDRIKILNDLESYEGY